MIPTERPKFAILAACATLLFAPELVSANDRDTQEVQRYTLTDAGLAKYRQATRNLAPLRDAIPRNCDDDANSTSVDAMVQNLDAVPRVKAAIQSGGMTTREYVLFSWSIFQNGLAAWAVSQPGGKLPPGTSQANVDFFKKHEAELQQLGTLMGDADCE